MLNRNNNFFFAGERSSQLKCPFAAHVRKTNPRDDLEVPPAPISPISVQPRRIMRRGVAFGPEVTPPEAASGKTKLGRGLLFNAYQTSISNGFQFLQHCESPCLILFRGPDKNILAWVDTPTFPPFTGQPFPAGYVTRPIGLIQTMTILTVSTRFLAKEDQG